MSKNNSEEKPQRLYFKSYLKLVRNPIGSNTFRNFYVRTSQKGEFDALDDGENSCAFYVSAILVIFGKASSMHGTVASTIKDLEKSGWQEVDKPEPGDVLVWEPQKFGEIWQKHIGFYVGKNRAVSTSWKKKTVVEHDQNFGNDKRKIEHIFRMKSWDDKPQKS